MDWDGRLTDPHTVAQDAAADGVFLGEPTAEDVQAFVKALASDEPIIMGQRPVRGWKRFWVVKRPRAPIPTLPQYGCFAREMPV